MASYELNAALKGIIEGFTEFLPISSTGHLVLVRSWLPLTGDPARVEQLDNLFDVVIQLPAILAIVILFWKRLWSSALSVFSKEDSRRFWISVVIAFFPAAVVGFLSKDYLEILMNPTVVGLALVLGGFVILAVERFGVAGKIERAEHVPYSTALSIGLVQCLSIIPGTSRSGATIIGARFFGLSRVAAAEFSFFLALPTMVGAFTLQFAKSFNQIQWATDGPILLIGSVSSFVTAWVVVSLFLRFIQKYSLAVFGWYRIGLGALILWVAFGVGTAHAEGNHLLSTSAGIASPSRGRAVFENPVGMVYTERAHLVLTGQAGEDFEDPRLGAGLHYGNGGVGLGIGLLTDPNTGYGVFALRSRELRAGIGIAAFKPISGGGTDLNAGVLLQPGSSTQMGVTVLGLNGGPREFGVGMSWDLAPTFAFAVDAAADDSLDSIWFAPGVSLHTREAALTVAFGIEGKDGRGGVSQIRDGVSVGVAYVPSSRSTVTAYYQPQGGTGTWFAQFELGL